MLGADIAYAWPSAEIAVMGPDGAANILFRKRIESAADPTAERARIIEDYRQRFLNPYAAAAAETSPNTLLNGPSNDASE